MIVRATVLKDASATAVCSSNDTNVTGSTGYQLGAVGAGQYAYAGLHLLSSSTGNAILCKILAASSSEFLVANPGTVIFTFTCQSCRDGQWAAPVAGPTSTDRTYWKLTWETTTSGRKFLGWLSISSSTA